MPAVKENACGYKFRNNIPHQQGGIFQNFVMMRWGE
jgi:hypothetical protein